MQRNYVEVQSLQRALDILEVISSSEAPVSLRFLTQETELPKSTVFRLLGNLEHRGYIRCNTDGTYQLGLRLLSMAQRMEQGFELKHLARPFLVQLNDRTRETVHLGVLDHDRIIYVDTVESPQPVRLVASLGASNPIYCTSLGKALMITVSDSEIASLLSEHGMPRRTDYTLVTPEQFLEEMKLVRQRGYAFDNLESADGCRCVGAPIFNHKKQAIAAISVSGPASRFTPELIEKDVVPLLLEATQQISHILDVISL